MKSNFRQFVLKLTIIFLALPIGAQEQDIGEKLIKEFLENVDTISGRFEQQLVDAEDNVIEKSSGTLDIMRPAKFRWRYSEPYQQILVADGLNIWIYDADLEQVTVRPQLGALESSPAALLSGSSSELEGFEYVGSFVDRETVWVGLRPDDPQSSFSKVEFGFTDGVLTRMLFGDNLGQTTLIALFDVKFNQPIHPGVVEFVPPNTVDVVGEPIIFPGTSD